MLKRVQKQDKQNLSFRPFHIPQRALNVLRYSKLAGCCVTSLVVSFRMLNRLFSRGVIAASAGYSKASGSPAPCIRPPINTMLSLIAANGSGPAVGSVASFPGSSQEQDDLWPTPFVSHPGRRRAHAGRSSRYKSF